VKVEVKNLNSFRAVRSSIAYELERQSGLLAAGGTVEQVNMGWDEERQRTVVQRSKEDARRLPVFSGARSAAAAGGLCLGGTAGSRTARAASCQAGPFRAQLGCAAAKPTS
jgi:hypothetical protein